MEKLRHLRRHLPQPVLVVLICALLSAGCRKEASDSARQPEPATPPAAAPSDWFMGGPAGDPSDLVVQVDDAELTRGELETRLDRVLAARRLDQLPPEKLREVRTQLRQDVINAFVGETVLLKEADRRGITVEESEIDKALGDIKGRIPAEAEFADVLTNFGTTEAKLRGDIERGMKINKILEQQVSDAAEVSDQDIADFYAAETSLFEEAETVHARHILIACDPDASEAERVEKKALADSYRTQIREGADFAELAKEFSDCPSKNSGGDLGTFPRGEMVKEFEEAAFSRPIDEIGPVVETDFGFHVIQVLARNEARTKPMEEVKEQISRYLQNRNRQAAVTQYVDGLKAEAEITYGDAYAE